MNTLVAASSNPGKIREIRLALGGLKHWTVEGLPPGLPEPEEDRPTFLENARLKALHYSRHLDRLTLADDSGLCVHALGGRPGVHSARYGPDAASRNRRVLDELQAAGAEDRGAAFVCALVLAHRGSVVWSVEMRLAGVIAAAPSGRGGFGYDPIFHVPALGRTLAELNLDEKNRISARGQALQRLCEFLAAS